MVALSTWQWINPTDYVYETLPDGLHVLVITCSTMWYTLKSSYNEKSNNEKPNNEKGMSRINRSRVASARTNEK